jgi:hypothetical protein
MLGIGPLAVTGHGKSELECRECALEWRYFTTLIATEAMPEPLLVAKAI